MIDTNPTTRKMQKKAMEVDMSESIDWIDEEVIEYVKKCLDGFKEKIQKLSDVSDLENLRDTMMLFKGLTPEIVNSADLNITSFADLYLKSDIIFIKIINAEIGKRQSQK